ncbi:hypothetical protein [Microtetraspora niveoalba]|uniref:hypothetical protein n=1 Tax=Microtetraspora niveoalba TaxID=46175 RepID=UPI000834320E|nr:hypothetical protein [Microtetraspora niveoalba]
MVDDPSTLINYWLSVWELNSFYARQPEQGERQRMWAETAMYALGRAEAAGPDTISADVSRFYLRAGLISDLGPMGSSLWNPDSLAADILAALPLRLEQAAEWAGNWQQRPRKEILALRRCKNLLGPAQRIRDYLSTTPTARELDQWLALREQLP